MASTTADYYEILGISRNSDTKAILKAYKKLALKYHPDRNIGNEHEASLKFQQVSEAAAILRDSEKRRMYDTYGITKVKDLIPKNVDDLFNMIFGDDNIQNGNNIITQSKVNVSFTECYYGTVKNQQISYWYCTSCGAFGENITRCYKCDGSCTHAGKKCSGCRGTGKKCDSMNNCPTTRLKQSLACIDVAIPAGSRHGDTVDELFNTKDNKKMINGIIKFDIECEQNEYEIKQNDLYIIQPVKISLSQALRAGDFIVAHLDENVYVTPTFQIIQPDTYYKIAGRGMRVSKKRNYVGDLYVKFEIMMPPPSCLQKCDAKKIYNALPRQAESQDNSDSKVTKVDLEDIPNHQSTLTDENNSYSCKKCNTVIASDIKNKDFKFNGKVAGLFGNATNIHCGTEQLTQKMSSGSYNTSWVYCATCNTKFGWKYINIVDAPKAHKNKIGKFCLQLGLLISPTDKANGVISETSVELSLSECNNGATKIISFAYKIACDECQKSKNNSRFAFLCGGDAFCDRCMESKKIEKSVQKAVEIPPGLSNGKIFPHFHKNKEIGGIVLIKIHCKTKNNDEYDMKTGDLYMKSPLKISLKQAIVGGKFLIDHFEEKLSVKPSLRIIQKDKYYKISGKDMKGTGNLCVKFDIEMPTNDQLDKSKIQNICDKLPNDNYRVDESTIIVQIEVPDRFDMLGFADGTSGDDLSINNQPENDCKVQ